MSSVARLRRTGSQNKTNYYNNQLVNHFKPERGIIPELEEDVPAGTIVAFTGSVDPKGWLICDGRELDLPRFEKLYAVIGTQFGSSGPYTFNIPDLRGAFLRGTGTNPTYPEYSGASLNTTQTHATQVHHHGITDPSHNHGITDPSHRHVQSGSGSVNEGIAVAASANVQNDGTSYTSYSYTGITINDASTGITVNDLTVSDTYVAGAPPVRVDNKETRPFNMGINWIIKA